MLDRQGAFCVVANIQGAPCSCFLTRILRRTDFMKEYPSQIVLKKSVLSKNPAVRTRGFDFRKMLFVFIVKETWKLQEVYMRERKNTKERKNTIERMFIKEPKNTKEPKYTNDIILYEAEYEKIKSDIFFELTDEKRRRKDKNLVPYYRYHHLIIRYRLLVDRDSCGQVKSFLITKPLLRIWGISKQELHKVALRNTKVIFPPRFRDMDRIQFSYLSQTLSEQEKEVICEKLGEVPMYLPMQAGSFHRYSITSKNGMNGAGALLYQGWIQKNLERFHLEWHLIYFMPISINEIVLFASEIPIGIKELKETAKKLYQKVPKEERLTKRVYCYDWKKGGF